MYFKMHDFIKNVTEEEDQNETILKINPIKTEEKRNRQNKYIFTNQLSSSLKNKYPKKMEF